MTLKSRALKLWTSLMIFVPNLVAADDPPKEGAGRGDFQSIGQGLWEDVDTQKADTTQDAFDGILDTLETVLGFIRTAGIVVAVLMLIWCAIQLASSAGNQQKRAMAMEGIKNVLIATAIIGGAALISQLALGILNH